MNIKKTSVALALAMSTALLSATPSFAQDKQITLTSSDGSANLVGELVEFVDGFYTIDTDIGRFRVSAARMTCEGGACPTITVCSASVLIFQIHCDGAVSHMRKN